MRPGRYDKLNFEESKQDFTYMLKEVNCNSYCNKVKSKITVISKTLLSCLFS
jgi:hypothetical protein